MKTFRTIKGKRKRFINALKEEYDIDEEELPNFEYCGAASNNYIKIFFKDFEVDIEDLKATSVCICGQNIKHQHFITDRRTKDSDPEVLVLGSDCIKSFTSFGKKRFCVECNAEHKNRNYSKCNKCLAICNCGGIKKKDSEKCNKCLSKICDCGKPKKTEYKTCYNCIPKRNCEQCNKIILGNKWWICWSCKFGDVS
tara:strand:- start:694 stop:1284 length:591 start_codon:yes stop_codon:yes gene_type:complete